MRMALVRVALWAALAGSVALGHSERYLQAESHFDSVATLSVNGENEGLRALSSLLSPGDTLFYLNGASTTNLIVLGKSLGPNGVILLMDFEDESASALSSQLQAHGLWERSLIINPSYVMATEKHGHFSSALNFFVGLPAFLRGHCPSLMVLRFQATRLESMDAVVTKALRLAIICGAAIYLDDVGNRLDAIAAAAHHLRSLGLALYRQRYRTPSGSALALVIVPRSSSAYSRLNQVLGLDVEEIIGALEPSVCSYGRAADAADCSEGVMVDLDVFVPPFTLSKCLLNLPQFAQYSEEIVTMALLLPDLDAAGVQASIWYQCTVWVETVAANMPTIAELESSDQHCSHQHIRANATAKEAVLAIELDVIIQNCVAFGQKRHSTLLTLQQLSQDSYAPPLPVDYPPLVETISYTGYDAMTVNMSNWLPRIPFDLNYDPKTCGEPVWCQYTIQMQEMIRNWQFPPLRSAPAEPFAVEEPQRSCENAKFLVYEVPSRLHGLGSMMLIIAAMFRFAICLDRILVLSVRDLAPELAKWAHPGCDGGVWDCYFMPITHCQLSYEVLSQQPVYSGESDELYHLHVSPLREKKILVVKEFLPSGPPIPCALCHSDWDVNSKFWSNVYLPHHNSAIVKFHDFNMHFTAFTGRDKLTWTSQFLRFLLRPRPWLVQAIDQVVAYSLHSPTHSHVPPQTFISLHIRYGAKIAEVGRQPLSRYMNFIARKLPYIKDIFLSTETEVVIGTISQEYPQYRFHFLRYRRVEYLEVRGTSPDQPDIKGLSTSGSNFADEMLMSLANLRVAAEADGFVGTLSSNWCMMIHHLERTRGDGGFDYFSMDSGSVFTQCF